MRGSLMEVRDVAPGLWIWRTRHPGWCDGADWPPVVTSTVAECDGEVVMLDPLAPADDATALWTRLDAHPPTVVVVQKPDHVRDVDLFAARYALQAFGPDLFYRGEVPRTTLQPVHPGSRLPGGPVALYDGRIHHDTPIWLPDQRAMVFADTVTERDGELRLWAAPWDEEGMRRVLRRLLELPFEHVIVSHGEPVHDRRAFEAALTRPSWSLQPG